MTHGLRQICVGATVLLVVVLLGSCVADVPGSSKQDGLFRDVTDPSGLSFVHINGGTGRKYLPEIMGSGGCTLDFDGDGLMDLYLVQSGQLPGAGHRGPRPVNRLYRNQGNGRFEDVTESSGAGDAGYGMGAVAGDFDNDGDPDIYVVNFGPDVLLRNDGDGTFTDVTRQAGIDSPLWGSSAAFVDADRDGDLDLYVANYVDFTLEKHIDCGTPSKGVLRYCHPDVYEMAPDVFFRNKGDGTFEDATETSGILDSSGKGLGVVAADFTNDGWPDIYVANDSTPNFLFENLGDGTFREVGLVLGVGYNEEGLTEAGMGSDAGDVNGDGYLDIVVTNLSTETNALYLGGPAEFKYHTRQSGLYAGSYLPVGFGTDLLDLDNDGDLDLLVTNGHVIDNIELIDDTQTFRQPSQVFWNGGEGGFVEGSPHLIGDIAEPRVGRGTIRVDFDNDGRLDVVITCNHDSARLFRNVLDTQNAWIGFLLEGRTGNADAVGARVTVESAAGSMIAERTAGSSYQTSSDPRLHFGLGRESRAERVVVQWPTGNTQVFEGLPAGHYYRLTEGGKPEPLAWPRDREGRGGTS